MNPELVDIIQNLELDLFEAEKEIGHAKRHLGMLEKLLENTKSSKELPRVCYLCGDSKQG